MGSKIKPRQQKLPRNFIAKDMGSSHKGGPMKNRRDKRQNNPNKNRWENSSTDW
jgi:hypothetical protein